eukprot:6020874-Pyramimonas_sp.AAC.1
MASSTDDTHLRYWSLSDPNIRSHSTSSLNLPGVAVHGIAVYLGMSQALRSRHVSQTPLIRLSLTLSRPAVVQMSLILSSVAWHHRQCSFRNSRVTTLGSRLREFGRLICTPNL